MPAINLPRVASHIDFGEFMDFTRSFQSLLINIRDSGSSPFNIAGSGTRRVTFRSSDEVAYRQNLMVYLEECWPNLGSSEYYMI